MRKLTGGVVGRAGALSAVARAALQPQRGAAPHERRGGRLLHVAVRRRRRCASLALWLRLLDDRALVDWRRRGLLRRRTCSRSTAAANFETQRLKTHLVCRSATATVASLWS